MSQIVFECVSKRIGGRQVLSNVDLVIPAGSLVALVGPSGSGKTMLLRLIAGLERPDSGGVTVGGRRVESASPAGVAMVFQGAGLYDHLDVGANLRFPLEVRGASPDHVEQVSRSTARRVGISRLWSRSPRALSGGERGLVAAARAISRDGLEVLLLDEPLAMADRHIRKRFRLELRRLHESEGVTTVVATNDQEEALALADLLGVVMDGRIVQFGPPRSVFGSPATADIASFVGTRPMNLFPGVVTGTSGEVSVAIGSDEVSLEGDPAVGEGTRVMVGLHAHELEVASGGTPFSRTIHVTVGRVEDIGSALNVLFGLGSVAAGTFVMTENRPAAMRPGDRLELTWAPGRMRLFRADTGRAIPM
jgi:multiple sugar transport system ATP-binding protein